MAIVRFNDEGGEKGRAGCVGFFLLHMANGQHIQIDRLQQVAVDCYAMLTDVEQEHVASCTECLAVFEAFVMTTRAFWNEQQAS